LIICSFAHIFDSLICFQPQNNIKVHDWKIWPQIWTPVF